MVRCCHLHKVQLVHYICPPATTWRYRRDRNARNGLVQGGEVGSGQWGQCEYYRGREGERGCNVAWRGLRHGPAPSMGAAQVRVRRSLVADWLGRMPRGTLGRRAGCGQGSPRRPDRRPWPLIGWVGPRRRPGSSGFCSVLLVLRF